MLLVCFFGCCQILPLKNEPSAIYNITDLFFFYFSFSGLYVQVMVSMHVLLVGLYTQVLIFQLCELFAFYLHSFIHKFLSDMRVFQCFL